jgi:hypothetical protein
MMNYSRKPQAKMDKVKLFLWCSIGALLGVLLAKLVVGQDIIPKDAKEKQPKTLIFADSIHGTWMRVIRTNTKDTTARGYDPSYTAIILAPELKATARKLEDGTMEIQFHSKIAQDMPPASSAVSPCPCL